MASFHVRFIDSITKIQEKHTAHAEYESSSNVQPAKLNLGFSGETLTGTKIGTSRPLVT